MFCLFVCFVCLFVCYLFCSFVYCLFFLLLCMFFLFVFSFVILLVFWLLLFINVGFSVIKISLFVFFLFFRLLFVCLFSCYLYLFICGLLEEKKLPSFYLLVPLLINVISMCPCFGFSWFGRFDSDFLFSVLDVFLFLGNLLKQYNLFAYFVLVSFLL